MKEVVIELKNINKTYFVSKAKNLVEKVSSFLKGIRGTKITSLSDINLTIEKGEILGIIGHNGAGKSTLLNIIMGNIKPDPGGEVNINGSVMRLSLGIGVDNNLTARENIYVNGSMLGLTFKEIHIVFHDIINFAELYNFVDIPVKFYSRGMRNRLLFAIALQAKADIFLLDEFFGGVGDEKFKQKSDKLFIDNILTNRTILLVSHSLSLIEMHCHRCVWLEKGRVRSIGKTADIIEAYRKNMFYKNA